MTGSLTLIIIDFLIPQYDVISEANQEKIVEAGGLGSLLTLLQSSEDETIRRVAAGAVANLAMNGM